MTRHFLQLRATLRWTAILAATGLVIGSASAFFLWALDAVTRTRFAHPWLLFFLPIGGLLVGLLYKRFGKSAVGGNLKIIAEIRQPGEGVPRRMAVMILVSTLVTHLGGGSAGREGTAVQMGGSIAAAIARQLRLEAAGVRLMLMVGVAAGFGAVFGTPVAGAVFALEVLKLGFRRVGFVALGSCFFTALLADWTCRAWGCIHSVYHLTPLCRPLPDLWRMGQVLLAAAVFGLAARLYFTLTQHLEKAFKTHIQREEFRPVVGGLLVIGLSFWVGNSDYLGLGVLAEKPSSLTLAALFSSPVVPASAWLWKLIFTAVTLSAGFKGGEVTPLFFIGAALGNSLATYFGAPVDLFAALGFVALFAAATKTPIASTLLGIELFGLSHGLYLGTACFVACVCSGPGSIYPALPYLKKQLEPLSLH